MHSTIQVTTIQKCLLSITNRHGSMICSVIILTSVSDKNEQACSEIKTSRPLQTLIHKLLYQAQSMYRYFAQREYLFGYPISQQIVVSSTTVASNQFYSQGYRMAWTTVLVKVFKQTNKSMYHAGEIPFDLNLLIYSTIHQNILFMIRILVDKLGLSKQVTETNL